MKDGMLNIQGVRETLFQKVSPDIPCILTIFFHRGVACVRRVTGMESMNQGKVFLVGAGPGDPELITLKAARRLRQADVVVYDYLANPRIMEHAPPSAERIYVGKQAGDHTMVQEDINALLVRLAEEGKTVVRLKGGDPYVFGRGGEEAAALHAKGLSFEVVPGITSAIAAPAFAGIPVTDRRLASSVAFITGHEDPGKSESSMHWDALAQGVDTLVFLMGMKNLPDIARRLVEEGRSPQTPAAVVHRGASPQQKTVVGTLSDIVEKSREAGMKAPSVVVVGDVVSLRDRLEWYESRPLFGKTIVVTRARAQASVFLEQLEELGARCISFPTIETRPPSSWDEADQAIRSISQYDWVLFTSTNGADYFLDRLKVLGEDVRALKGISLGAIGPATAEALEARGLRVDFVPSEYRAEGIIDELSPKLTPGTRILIPRALKAREVLPEKLAEAGASVHVVPAYETVLPSERAGEVEALFEAREIDMVTFTSSSTVTNFLQMFEGDRGAELLSGVVVACIGPVTAETAKKHGISTGVQPDEYTIDALTASIAAFYSKPS